MGRHANVNAACRRIPCRQAANLFMGVVAAGRHPPYGPTWPAPPPALRRGDSGGPALVAWWARPNVKNKVRNAFYFCFVR